MFTGIVAEVGTVQRVERTVTGCRLVIEGPHTVERLSVGDSVAVNGVCLTAVTVGEDSFTVDAVAETLDRSNLAGLAAGVGVNLERPVPSADGRFDGHIVQGHIDGVGTIETIDVEGEARRIRVVAPPSLAPYLVEKGAVTIDGVSLTITAVSALEADETWFEVVLIPHTLEVTVLARRSTGDQVNIESDIFAKYVERLMGTRA
ncbi:MAG: riboflavin synthase [Acidimicrobiia bacterium]|nr:MAG: riboflavin synthase [Acidimicrobiia bacterium]